MMNKYILKTIAVMSLIYLPVILLAQQPKVEMAELFRSEGKIYVVIGVFAIVMLVLFIYLFMMDRKIRQLEDRMNNKT